MRPPVSPDLSVFFEVLQYVDSPAVGFHPSHPGGLNTIITVQRVLGSVYFYPNCQHHHSVVCDPNLHSTSMQYVALLPIPAAFLRAGPFLSSMFCLIKNVIAKTNR